ncbi:hypothetical protein BwSF12_59380 [Bradyrhizobium ottawaense]|nr:hypothetical protein BwSH14_01830 [Bradyrhizobium ottawaense]GMO50096.1 hypothetical protein BwSF12_59380 [Bradyrhizobium ottawaense]GMO77279.1 hypothetical protein BwSG20_51370 [Bradyrhizobium ottawaense]
MTGFADTAPGDAAAEGDAEVATNARLANAASTMLRPAAEIMGLTVILTFL